MATQDGNSSIGGMSKAAPIERDLDMAEAGESSGTAGQRAGKSTCVSFMAASKRWDSNMNGKRLRNEISEPVSTPGNWRSRMEQTVRQQAHITPLVLQVYFRDLMGSLNNPNMDIYLKSWIITWISWLDQPSRSFHLSVVTSLPYIRINGPMTAIKPSADETCIIFRSVLVV